MPTSTYYDSCIFLNAHNKTHRQHHACAAITAPENVTWLVWICRELIASETTAIELVNAFEVGCALAGVIVAHSHLVGARALAAKHKSHKQQLKKLQLKDRDFTHLMCAVSSGAEALATVDPDFWDATNKRNPGAKKLRDGTKRVIEAAFPIRIMSPVELAPA
jgi:hypothetical protein